MRCASLLETVTEKPADAVLLVQIKAGCPISRVLLREVGLFADSCSNLTLVNASDEEPRGRNEESQGERHSHGVHGQPGGLVPTARRGQ